MRIPDPALALISAHRAGQKDALDRLFRELAPTLRRFCHALARRSGDDGDDLYQDTLLHVLRYLDAYRGEAAFSTWVYTVARSRCIRRRRRVRAGTDALGSPLDLRDEDLRPGSLEEDLESWEIARHLEATIDRLSAVDREILVCRDGLGMSAMEVAAQLGLTVAAVKTRLHRARNRVRNQLDTTLRNPELPCALGQAPA